MVVLKYSLFSLFIFAVAPVFGSCDSAYQFSETVSYLRRQKNFTLPDSEIFKTALLVSENCNGAASRFRKMLDTLTQTGVDHNHALRFAVDYSQQDTESVDAFLSLYQGLVLEKKFNLPYYQAFETAKFFAESSTGNKKEMKKDFLGFLSFCFEDPKGTMLSLEQCRALSLKYLKLHAQYPRGVFDDFRKLFTFLRDSKDTGLAIANALAVTQVVLENGPGAKDNFIDSYKYSMNELNLKPGQSLTLALKLASFTKSKNEK